MISLAKRGAAPYVPAHATRSSRGFSLVELLVTIVIAAIAFSAMVPMFVGAQQKTSGDRMRNTALNLAQDRVEKIRQLSFDEACSASAIASELGTSWTSYGGSSSKTFSIAYTSVPGGGASPTFTAIGVTVSWSAPPAPVMPVTLKTIVVDNAIAAVGSSPSPTASPSPSVSPSPSTSPSPSGSPSPSPSPSATYANKKYSLNVASNEWYKHTISTLQQINVSPVVAVAGTPIVFDGTSKQFKNLPSGRYRITHVYGWWNFQTEVSEFDLVADLTLRYDNYLSSHPGF